MNCSAVTRAWALLGILATAPAAALADEPSASVTVRASALGEAESKAPTSFVAVIEPDAHAGEVETVTDALAESVGVSVRRFGGLGAFSTLSIRGSSANQVQIFLDGVPLSRARNETVSLGDLPLESLSRIEVYRGTAPVHLGGAGLGGVVSLISKPPSETPEGQISGSYGSFDTRKVTASYSRRVGDVGLLGYATYLGSAGNFHFKDSSPNASTDTTHAVDQRRINNAFDALDTLLKGTYAPLPHVDVDVTSELLVKDQGVPGNAHNQSPDASFDNLRSLNYLRARTSDFVVSHLDTASTFYAIYERAQFKDPTGRIGTGVQDRDDQSRVFGGKLNGTYYLANDQALEGDLDVSHELFSPATSKVRTISDADAWRVHTNVGLQHQSSWFDDRLMIVPTLRYENVHDRLTGDIRNIGRPPVLAQTTEHDLFSPSIGAQVRWLSWFATRANIGRFQRAPNFTELFGNSGSFVGNPTLRPETAVNRDVGFVIAAVPPPWIRDAHLEYAYFSNDVDDLILPVQNSPSFARPENISGARLSGHEVSAHVAAIRFVQLDVNYTNQDTYNRSHVASAYTGKQLPGRPADELYTRLELVQAPAKLYYEFNFVSGNFFDQANFQKPTSDRRVHTLGLRFNLTEWAALNFEAQNFTDSQVSDVGGFPLPGRSFFGTISCKL